MNRKNLVFIDDESDNIHDNTRQTRFKISKTSKIEQLIDEKNFKKALDLTDELLESEAENTDYLNLKGIILDNLCKYDEAVECFTKAITINKSEELLKNKAETLFKYAKTTYFPDMNYQKALKLIDEAFEIIPSSETQSEYHFLKAEILEAMQKPVDARKHYLIAYEEFDKLDEFEKQIDYLKNTSETLINITGTNFYSYTPVNGQIVDLIRETNNEHDPDAISVEIEGEKVGYVANSEYTLTEEVKSASSIKNFLKENQKAEILFTYLDSYIIARLL